MLNYKNSTIFEISVEFYTVLMYHTSKSDKNWPIYKFWVMRARIGLWTFTIARSARDDGDVMDDVRALGAHAVVEMEEMGKPGLNEDDDDVMDDVRALRAFGGGGGDGGVGSEKNEDDDNVMNYMDAGGGEGGDGGARSEKKKNKMMMMKMMKKKNMMN